MKTLILLLAYTFIAHAAVLSGTAANLPNIKPHNLLPSSDCQSTVGSGVSSTGTQDGGVPAPSRGFYPLGLK